MLYSLEGKTVLITGSSLGIGRATAHVFAKKKCHLILTYFKDENEGKVAKEECLKKGARSVNVFSLDIRSEKSIQQFKKNVLKKRKKIHVLVNNAGIFVHKPLLENTIPRIEEEVKTNLLGPIRVTRAFLSQGVECVINIASEAGLQAYPRMPVYCATKFGVRGFTRGMAIDYPTIRWYAVNPDYTATRMTHFKGMPPSSVGKIVVEAAQGNIPVKNGYDVNVTRWVSSTKK
jgi:NAD(P)-dependent dehydrogenase (short-subunit alcohol dehydrogenase family)